MCDKKPFKTKEKMCDKTKEKFCGIKTILKFHLKNHFKKTF